MKIKNVSMSLAALVISTQAAAVEKSNELLDININAANQIQKVSHADFGVYKIEKSLALVPSTIADTNNVVGIKGNNAVVKLNEQIDSILPGSLVRNIFTGNLAPISGKINVLLAEGVSGADIESATGLELVTSFSGTDLAIVSVAGDKDVMSAVEALKASGLVKETRIEVLESYFSAR